MTFDDFSTLEYLEESLEVVNVNMDGCTPYHLFDETCRDDLITEVYNGSAMSAYDINLNPYTGLFYILLTLSQMKNFRLFQTERVCRQQF